MEMLLFRLLSNLAVTSTYKVGYVVLGANLPTQQYMESVCLKCLKPS